MDQTTLMLYLGAVALGALHAFEPGHGKTLIAAYMVGVRGRAFDGLLLGLIVTFTHTFSVIILGIVATLLSHSYSETQLHNWLGLLSAIVILIVGIWMLKRRLSGDGSGAHAHVHFWGHGHTHHDHAPHHHGHDDHPHHDHNHHHHDHGPDKEFAHTPTASASQGKQSKWDLLLLGISGGLVPCPAAIATLLLAIGAGRASEGLIMTVFFSLGLGAVMMSIGVLMSQAGRLTEKISSSLELGRKLGIVSAALITVLGFYTLLHSLYNIVNG